MTGPFYELKMFDGSGPSRRVAWFGNYQVAKMAGLRRLKQNAGKDRPQPVHASIEVDGRVIFEARRVVIDVQGSEMVTLTIDREVLP